MTTDRLDSVEALAALDFTVLKLEALRRLVQHEDRRVRVPALEELNARYPNPFDHLDPTDARIVARAVLASQTVAELRACLRFHYAMHPDNADLDRELGNHASFHKLLVKPNTPIFIHDMQRMAAVFIKRA